jgi:hypothetical protein
MLQVRPGLNFCSFLALLDIVNRFGGRNPTLRVDVVHARLREQRERRENLKRLHTLCVVL